MANWAGTSRREAVAFDRVSLLTLVVAATPTTEVPTPSTVKSSPFQLALFSFVSRAFWVIENTYASKDTYLH